MTAQLLSVMALWMATVLYAISMLAYAIRLSRIAEATGARRAQVAVAAGSGSQTAAAPEVPAASKRVADKPHGIARASVVVGVLAHAVGVVARGIEAGHVPWSNMYEYTITGTFAAVAVFVVVQMRRDISFLGAGVTGFAALGLGLIAMSMLYSRSTGLPVALQSTWLIVHVSIAIAATGVFVVAFFMTLLQLGRDHRDAGTRWLQGKALRFLEAVPTPQRLEGLAFRLHAVGFVMWTFTVMAGAVWAEQAWGRYWGWDPKEVWSFVIWVLYAAYLHARTTRGWAGRRSAYLSIAGFVALILNFTVVNFVLQGLHSYA